MQLSTGTLLRQSGQHAGSTSHEHSNANDDYHDALLNRTDQLFTELQRIIEHSGASSPIPHQTAELLDYPSYPHTYKPRSLFAQSGKMPPKKSGRAMLREEGALDTWLTCEEGATDTAQGWRGRTTICS